MARDPYVISAVERELRQLIAGLEPGAQLPGERDLAQHLGASRPTIREVVSRMSRSGHLVRRWGSGTFVPTLQVPFVLDLNGSVVLRLDARAQGFDAWFSDVSCALSTPPGGGSEEPEWTIHRVLRLNDSPVMRLTDRVPLAIAGTELDFTAFGGAGHEDLILHIQEQTGLTMTSMDAALRTVVADDVAAKYLDVEEGSPLLVNEFLGTAAEGQLLTRSRAEYVQGRVELRFRTAWLKS